MRNHGALRSAGSAPGVLQERNVVISHLRAHKLTFNPSQQRLTALERLRPGKGALKDREINLRHEAALFDHAVDHNAL